MVKYAAKPQSGFRRHWLIAIVLTVIILFVGGVFVVRKYYFDNLKPVSTSQTSVNITITTGMSLSQVTELLYKNKLIRNEWAFRQFVLTKALEDDIQAGTYAITPSQSVSEIVDIITEGRVASKLVTIKPAKRIDQVAQGLINSGFAPGAVEAALSPSLYASHPALVDKPATASLEGYLYPESFQKTAETTPKQIIQASLDEMQKRLTPDVREAFSEQGLSVFKAVTLASIIEKEVSSPDDRAQVAQIFLKRLKLDMRLESDATARYGAILAGADPSVSYESAYNTYSHDGLPPGPISNVTASSLQAVAHPAKTDWLYFVSGDDGTTHFSKTLAEHQALTAQYCHKLCN